MCSSFRVCLSGPVREKGWVDVWSQTNLKMGPADRFKNGRSPDRMKVAPKQPVLSVFCFPLQSWRAQEDRLMLRTRSYKCLVQGDFLSPCCMPGAVLCAEW